MKFGNQKRNQWCRVYRVEGIVEKQELAVARSCIRIPDVAGFLFSSANQFRDEKTKVSWQLLYETSCVPIDLRREIKGADAKNLIALTDKIYSDNHKEVLRQQFTDAKKGKLWDKMMWIIAMPCSVIMIWGVIFFLKR